MRGLELHNWFVHTEVFKKMMGQSGGEKGIDNDFVAQSLANVGAWILGRNIFGPVLGPWPDDSWKGWWGPNPPYHCAVFVLTHHTRPSLTMEGGTTFHFVTDGVESALERAREAARDKEVRIGGGVSAIRQYLTAGHIDELHLAVPPVLLGEGENLFAGTNVYQLGYTIVRMVAGENATHVLIEKEG